MLKKTNDYAKPLRTADWAVAEARRHTTPTRGWAVKQGFLCVRGKYGRHAVNRMGSGEPT